MHNYPAIAPLQNIENVHEQIIIILHTKYNYLLMASSIPAGNRWPLKTKYKQIKQIHFRAATLEDLPVLYEFEQGVIAAERPYDETLKTGHITYYDLKSMIESDEAEVIVAIIEKKIVGSGYADIRKSKPYLKHSRYAYLGFMYVIPEYRGNGINKKLIEELKNWAQAKNINEVRLDVYYDNHSAIKAYEKAGFKKHMINMRI